MAVIKPFRALMPEKTIAYQVAALPYDVYSRAEARECVKGNPLSFLNIDRPETQFPEDFDMYSPLCYQKAREMLEKEIEEGIYVRDKEKHYYIYSLTMNGRTQTGIAAVSSVDDYLSGVIKKHENTVLEKEIDRIKHVDSLSAQTGPIFLCYRENKNIKNITEEEMKKKPLMDITFSDKVRHRIWIVDNDRTKILENEFSNIPNTYIADGHHRAQSAVKTALKRREKYKDYDGKEEFNFFLSVLFPDTELYIMDYNRVVRDLNGLTRAEFFEKLSENFDIKETSPHVPEEKGEFNFYIEDKWYRAHVKKETLDSRKQDPVSGLDVSLLQDLVLEGILGIQDPRTDRRISFVGGIRGLKTLEDMVKSLNDSEKYESAVAFSMHPTSISELLNVADSNLLMPPKSTWFEPKLRSGFLIHEFER